MIKAEPWYCIVCKHKPEGYYGRLVFPEELKEGKTPLCPNHGKGQEQPLVPVR